MGVKTKQKYDKCVKQFSKISNEHKIYRESAHSLFTYLDNKLNFNDIEEILTTFVKKYLTFADQLLMTQIELCKNSNEDYEILSVLKKYLDVERMYCFLYWMFANSFNDSLNSTRQDYMILEKQQKSRMLSSLSGTLNQSAESNSDFAGAVGQTQSQRSLQVPPARHDKKSSISTGKRSFMVNSDSFVIRRCVSTIKRIRQLLFSINYVVVHKRNFQHKQFFEMFREYNEQVFDVLVRNLEKKKFGNRNLQLIKAIYNLTSELFNSQIQQSNTNFIKVGENDLVMKIKNSLSKFSSTGKKIILNEDRQAQQSPAVFNIFNTNRVDSSNLKLKDTRIFTEPRLNFPAKKQLSECYMILFHLKGEYESYQAYDDLIEDQLINVSDSDSDTESYVSETELQQKANELKRFTFSKAPSENHKRKTTSDNKTSGQLDTSKEKNPRPTQQFDLFSSKLDGKRDSFLQGNIMKENALKSILESIEASESHDTPDMSRIELETKTDEVPLEEYDQNISDEFDTTLTVFDDPFFSKLGITKEKGPKFTKENVFQSYKDPELPSEDDPKTKKFWENMQSFRESQFRKRNMSKIQIRKMRKALDQTEHKQVLSSLILTAHNPFSHSIPQMNSGEGGKNIVMKQKATNVNSCFREIFYSPEYSKLTGIEMVDDDMRRDGAEHLIYIMDRLMIPNLRDRITKIKPPKGAKTPELRHRLREILKTKTGLIHLVNEYEEKRLDTYKKLLKKDAKSRAKQDYYKKLKEEEGNIISTDKEFNPYRNKHFPMSPKGDVKFELTMGPKITTKF